MAPCAALTSPASCEKEGTPTSGFSLLCIFFLSPKICWCGRWRWCGQRSRSGVPALLPRLEDQDPGSPGRQQRCSVPRRGTCACPHFSSRVPLLRQKRTPQTITASHPVRAAGQEVTGGTPGPLCHPGWCPPSQILLAAPTSGPETSNLGWKRSSASQHPRRLVPIPLGSCSAPLSPADTGHLVGAWHSLPSPQFRGTAGTVTGGGGCPSLPPHRQRTLRHGTNPTLICSPQLKQPM